jgi:hypothetical protein
MNRNVAEAARILGVNGQQVKTWAWSYKDYLSGQRIRARERRVRSWTRMCWR